MTGILHIVVARKPVEGTIAENCLCWHTGALNIDDCRIGIETWDAEAMQRANTPGSGRMKTGGGLQGTSTFSRSNSSGEMDTTAGRWPANLVLDTSNEIQKGFPMALGFSGGGIRRKKSDIMPSIQVKEDGIASTYYADSGYASRFFFNFTEQESDE